MADDPVRHDAIEEQRHSTLYMDDGDLVISAPSSTNGRIVQFFRVHKLILSLHSLVFKDMLSIGENSDNEKYDGAPRVHLRDDPAEDVAGLVGALYNPATLPLVRLSPDTPLKVQGIMRLATKYQVDTIRTVILRHIEADWPTTLAEWDRRYAESRCPGLSEPYNGDTGNFLVECDYALFPEPASAIRFAMEFDCPKILPAAFYELASVSDVVEWKPERLKARYSRPARWQMLQNSDLLRIMKGKRALERQWRTMKTEIMMEVDSSCAWQDMDADSGDRDQPQRNCVDCVKNLLESACTISASDPLCALRYVDAHVTGDEMLCCGEGYEIVRSKSRELAQESWDLLPMFLELEGLFSH